MLYIPTEGFCLCGTQAMWSGYYGVNMTLNVGIPISSTLYPTHVRCRPAMYTYICPLSVLRLMSGDISPHINCCGGQVHQTRKRPSLSDCGERAYVNSIPTL